MRMSPLYLSRCAGGYRTSDEPHPRGEVWLGGGNIALGYYNSPQKTADEFHTIDGMRWFATGDIGRIESDGCLKIIGKINLSWIKFPSTIMLIPVEL